MLARIISGLIGIPLVVVVVFWPGGIPFVILVALVGVLGQLEFYGSTRRRGVRPHMLLGIAIGLLMIYFGWSGWCPQSDTLLSSINLIYLIPAFTALILGALVIEIIRTDRAPVVNVGTTILGVAYVPWLLLHFVMLRLISGKMVVYSSKPIELGAWLVMFVLLATWALDTAAYFVGKFYGKNKMAPNLSPGKTWEGSVAGFLFAVVIGAVAGAIIRMPQPHGLILGALIGVFGQVGDLAESALKRELGIKDFGNLIPGHGGVLDRLDSLLFTGPITFWYIVVVLSGWIASFKA
jgi:phosphatidate cytidylyltransferase